MKMAEIVSFYPQWRYEKENGVLEVGSKFKGVTLQEGWLFEECTGNIFYLVKISGLIRLIISIIMRDILDSHSDRVLLLESRLQDLFQSEFGINNPSVPTWLHQILLCTLLL